MTGWTVVLVLGAAACTRSAAAASYQVGDSMVPSIAVGTRIALLATATPSRGQVLVFHGPESPDRSYVKRIIGLPGDTIATEGTTVVVNGTPIARCDVGPWTFEDHGGEIRLESLGGESWLVFDEAVPHKTYGHGPWHVAAGEVFVLGDNRGNSHDSRLWFGGRGGGVPLRLFVGVSDPAAPSLPSDAQSLAPALADCLARFRGNVTAGDRRDTDPR